MAGTVCWLPTLLASRRAQAVRTAVLALPPARPQRTDVTQALAVPQRYCCRKQKERLGVPAPHGAVVRLPHDAAGAERLAVTAVLALRVAGLRGVCLLCTWRLACAARLAREGARGGMRAREVRITGEQVE